MRKKAKLMDKIDSLVADIDELKKVVSVQNEEIKDLKHKLESATIHTDESGATESFGNLILNEIVSIKKKLEGFSAESLRALINDVAALKNSAENGSPEFSLSELKDELIKLADMMTI